MSRKLTVIIVALIIMGGAWYAFRLERLFVNQKVNEQFPTASAATATTTTLGTGSFHSVALLDAATGQTFPPTA